MDLHCKGRIIMIAKKRWSCSSLVSYALNNLKGMERLLNESTTVEK
jgi:hypothetical protein